MSGFKNISFPIINGVFNSKEDALSKIGQHLAAHSDSFADGNLISFRYLSGGVECLSIAVIRKNGGDAFVNPLSNDDASIMPISNLSVNDEDKDPSLLYIEGDDSTSASVNELSATLSGMKADIEQLFRLTDKHEYGFKYGLSPGNIYNSAAVDIETSANEIKPEDAIESEEEPVVMEPDYEGKKLGNVKHIMLKYADTEETIKQYYKKYTCAYELIWCIGNKGLYINNNGILVKINSFTGNGESNLPTTTVVEGITSSDGAVDHIIMRSDDGTLYEMRADKGTIVSYEKKTQLQPPSGETNTFSPNIYLLLEGTKLGYLYINMIYCGGVDGENSDNAIIDEHSYNYCSHNFVELSNVSDKDICLDGLSLQYAKDGLDWAVLPLKGVIKKGSTFLVRGAQCSVMDVNTTKIKVKTYDMEWFDNNTGKPIQFSNICGKFYLTYGTEPCSEINPYKLIAGESAPTFLYGYIDLVGLDDGGAINAGASEKKPYSYLSSDRIFTKYYNLDPAKQANKEMAKRNNANDWYFVDLTKNDGDIIPNISAYTPKASAENKNIFFNKTMPIEDRPSVITCTFGIQATDNGEGATRCFNWVSKNYYDEYVWISRDKNDFSQAVRYESVHGITDKNDINHVYNRIRLETTDGTPITVHKCIVRGLEAGTYYYKAGRSLELATDVRSFTVITNAKANEGFRVVQTSDQQGFNWDEYQVWKWAAGKIAEESPNFLINTGDMTQNGNRINEWFDYFNAKGEITDLEDMATIGNNDLCSEQTYFLGNGGDLNKINPITITLFYTFEADEENPCIFDITNDDGTKVVTNIYIPSLYSFNFGNIHFLCVNSEITISAEQSIFKLDWVNASNYGYIYEKVKNWCQADIDKYKPQSNWVIAYCHEMPFTILTQAVVKSASNEDSSEKVILRGGSHLNTVARPGNEYWFSKFCQDNGIRLVLGGHKHTEAISYPILENTNTIIKNYTLKPIIQTTGDVRTVTSGTLSGLSYPVDWFQGEMLNPDYVPRAHLCTFEKVDKITAPIYAMSQATGYKHTSNKELPGLNIPWLAHYYPSSNNGTTVNAGQRYPFYTVWDITPESINGTVKKVKGVFNAGKFNINIEGEKVKNGSPVGSENYAASECATVTITKDNSIIETK